MVTVLAVLGLVLVIVVLLVMLVMELPPKKVQVPITKVNYFGCDDEEITPEKLHDLYENIKYEPGTIIKTDDPTRIVYKPKKRGKKMKRKIKITEFVTMVSRNQKGGKGNKVNVADIAEIVRTIRRILKENTGVDIYSIIKRIDK